MNFRRLVSAVAALAVAGTMCAGLAVTASAADYSSYELDAIDSWTLSDSSYLSNTTVDFFKDLDGNEASVAAVKQSNKNAYRPASYYYDTAAAPDEGYAIQLDFTLGMSSSNHGTGYLDIMGTNTAVAAGKTYYSNSIVYFSIPTQTAALSVNGTDVSDYVTFDDNASSGSYYQRTRLTPVRVVMDFDSRMVVVSIADAEGEYTQVYKGSMNESTSTGFYGFIANPEQYGAISVTDVSLSVADPITNPSMTFTTTPYALATINDVEYYSGDDGVITLDRPETETTYSYTVEKGGYTSVSGTATADSETTELATAELTLNTDYLYYEDFNTVTGETSVSESLSGSTGMFDIYALYGTVTLTADNYDLDIYNGGGGPRSIQYPLNVSTTDFEFKADITANSTGGTQIILRDAGVQQYAAIYIDGSGNATFSAPGTTYNTYNSLIGEQTYSLGSITLGTAVTVDVKVDTTNGIVIASIGDNDPVTVTGFAKSDTRGAYATLTDVMIASARYFTTTIDNIVVTSYTTPADPEITNVDVSTAATSVIDTNTLEKVSGNDLSLDGTETVTTYTILVENGDSTNVPTLVTTIDSTETLLTPSGTDDNGDAVVYGYAGTDGYIFVIQTIGIDQATQATLDNVTFFDIATE